MSSLLPVTLDPVRYDAKPSGREIGAITRRLQASGPVAVTGEELAQAIADGRTWCGGCFEPSQRRWGRFIGQRIFAFDVDNDAIVTGEDGKPLKDEHNHVVKRDLHKGEKGFLDPWDALARFRDLFGTDPLVMYPSFHFEQVADLSSYPTRCKYRLLFDAGESVKTEARAKDVLTKLLRCFPEADQGCSNANRLFFGSCGKAVLFREGRPYYAKRAR